MTRRPSGPAVSAGSPISIQSSVTDRGAPSVPSLPIARWVRWLRKRLVCERQTTCRPSGVRRSATSPVVVVAVTGVIRCQSARAEGAAASASPATARTAMRARGDIRRAIVTARTTAVGEIPDCRDVVLDRDPSRMSSLFALPAGRLAKWLFALAWLVIVVVVIGANLPGKFADAEKNESTSFLPGSAESTKALHVTERLQDGEKAATVIVYRRDGGLTAQDRRAITNDVAQLNRITARFANSTPFGNPAQPRGPVPYELSKDGTTALIANQLTGTGEGSDILDPVDAYRAAVSENRSDGLQVKVAGPAGISADAIKVFEGINGTLVGAAFLLVIVLLVLIYRSPVFWFFPILAVAFAEITARGIGWGLTEAGVTVNGQSSAILSVLVIGAGTDYALLLVARYREELRRHEDKHEAMAHRAAARRPGDLRLRPDGVRRAAVALAREGQRHRRPRPDRRDGHRGRRRRDADLPAGAAAHRRAQAVLAVHPPRRRHRLRRDARLLAPGRRRRRPPAGDGGDRDRHRPARHGARAS